MLGLEFGLGIGAGVGAGVGVGVGVERLEEDELENDVRLPRTKGVVTLVFVREERYDGHDAEEAQDEQADAHAEDGDYDCEEQGVGRVTWGGRGGEGDMGRKGWGGTRGWEGVGTKVWGREALGGQFGRSSR